MKKVFVEPKMNRIELNLKENIAASVTTDGYCVHGNDQIELCDVHELNMTAIELIGIHGIGVFGVMASCKADGSSKFHENETIVPTSVVMRYVRG